MICLNCYDFELDNMIHSNGDYCTFEHDQDGKIVMRFRDREIISDNHICGPYKGKYGFWGPYRLVWSDRVALFYLGNKLSICRKLISLPLPDNATLIYASKTCQSFRTCYSLTQFFPNVPRLYHSVAAFSEQISDWTDAG